MKTGLKSVVSRVVRWIRETWAELDYAQHRMIELQLVVLCQVQDFGVTRRPRRKSFFPITTPFHGIRSIGFWGRFREPHKALLTVG
jgi:hypothetical protein